MTNQTLFSRRLALKFAAGAGLTLAVSPVLAAGTGSPKRGGHLVTGAGGGSTSNSLDPRTFNSPYTSVLSGIIYNTLIDVRGLDMQLVPSLARSWNPSNNGKTWTFELETEAKFHDGKPFTSEDAVYSLKMHADKDSRSNVRSVIAGLSDIRADGPGRLVIELPEPNYVFPALLTSFPVCMVPAGTTKFEGIGTGPYQVTRFAPGEVLEAKRNESYFRKDAAWVDTVEHLAINDPSSLASAFQSGQVQLATQLDPRTAGLFGRMPNLKLYKTQGRGFLCINMRADTAPFNNADLRMALKLAIDREDILKRVNANLGAIGNDTPVAPSDPVYAKNVPQLKYDPEKAREYYKKSGHSGSLVLQTSDAISSSAIDLAAAFKEHAAKAGIEIEVKREPADGYWENVVGVSPFHISARNDRPSADQILSIAFLGTSQNNETHWKNAEFDAAVIAARGEADPEKRKQYYEKVQEICSRDGATIIPVFSGTIDGGSADVDGFIPGALQMASLRAVEQVWFA